MLYAILWMLVAPWVWLFMPVKIFGKQYFKTIKNKSAIYSCNHYTLCDPVIIKSRCPRLKCMAKAELFKNKFNGFFIKKFGGYPIDRGSTDVKAFKFALQTLKDKHILGIFPEGTRNKSGSEEMGDIKSGAIVFASKANVPIVPMVLVKPIKFLRRTTLIIGDPFMCEGENPTRLTKDEIEKNVELLAEKTNALREEYNNGIEEKRNRKKLK